jgi:hypothetical protein
MQWGRVGSVHASAPYVIEPYTEHYGVVRYRLTGGGLDELSRDVRTLKQIAEVHQRRLLIEAQEQRRREAEARKQRAANAHHQAEIRDRVVAVLTPAESEAHPDWVGLTRAEIEDCVRHEAAELFARRQAEARYAADSTEARQRAIIERAEAALARTETR